MLPKDINLYHPLQTFPAKCLVEMQIIRSSQEIRSKSNWHQKILQPEITEKWRTELESHGLTFKVADYVIAQVKYLSTLKQDQIEPGPVQGTWVADNLIDDEICTRLKKLVAERLENVTPEKKDYHPGSDNMVVDLVHPSLYCFVENKSILINDETINKEFLPSTVTKHESKYRWLRSEISVKTDGSISVDSYINNLHPYQNEDLYGTISEILQKIIPMFSRTLTDVTNWQGSIIDLSNWGAYEYFNGPSYEVWERTKSVLPIPVPDFKKPSEPENQIELKGEQLQVIFKLSNIELTPEKPEYGGGTWHVEGIDKERIVATGIYYYDIENITESKLSFRQSVETPLYEQNDSSGVLTIYGMFDEDQLNQVIGSFTAEKGRCIVFANSYQHQVAPFKLVDKTKPGFRKILVFFLVDPTVKVISTHNVLPQQPDWNDVQWEVAADKRLVMTREEAEDYRQQLMFERKYVRDTIEKYVYERVFSLCEH